MNSADPCALGSSPALAAIGLTSPAARPSDRTPESSTAERIDAEVTFLKAALKAASEGLTGPPRPSPPSSSSLLAVLEAAAAAEDALSPLPSPPEAAAEGEATASPAAAAARLLISATLAESSSFDFPDPKASASGAAAKAATEPSSDGSGRTLSPLFSSPDAARTPAAHASTAAAVAATAAAPSSTAATITSSSRKEQYPSIIITAVLVPASKRSSVDKEAWSTVGLATSQPPHGDGARDVFALPSSPSAASSGAKS